MGKGVTSRTKQRNEKENTKKQNKVVIFNAEIEASPLRLAIMVPTETIKQSTHFP